MNKKLVFIIAVLASSMTVHAGLEAHYSFADKTTGTVEIKILNTETGEVVETGSFRYVPSSINGDTFMALASLKEEDEELAKGFADVPAGHSDGDEPVLDATATESSPVDSDDLAVSVGVWDAIRSKLQASKASLSKALEHLESKYDSLVNKDSTDEATESSAEGIVLTVEKVPHTITVVAEDVPSEDSSSVVVQDAEVEDSSVPK